MTVKAFEKERLCSLEGPCSLTSTLLKLDPAALWEDSLGLGSYISSEGLSGVSLM